MEESQMLIWRLQSKLLRLKSFLEHSRRSAFFMFLKWVTSRCVFLIIIWNNWLMFHILRWMRMDIESIDSMMKISTWISGRSMPWAICLFTWSHKSGTSLRKTWRIGGPRACQSLTILASTLSEAKQTARVSKFLPSGVPRCGQSMARSWRAEPEPLTSLRLGTEGFRPSS